MVATAVSPVPSPSTFLGIAISNAGGVSLTGSASAASLVAWQNAQENSLTEVTGAGPVPANVASAGQTAALAVLNEALTILQTGLSTAQAAAASVISANAINTSFPDIVAAAGDSPLVAAFKRQIGLIELGISSFQSNAQFGTPAGILQSIVAFS